MTKRKRKAIRKKPSTISSMRAEIRRLEDMVAKWKDVAELQRDIAANHIREAKSLAIHYRHGHWLSNGQNDRLLPLIEAAEAHLATLPRKVNVKVQAVVIASTGEFVRVARHAADASSYERLVTLTSEYEAKP